ncbi:MAG: hypothetical protein H5T95_14185, partial [Firmicutes bacterium]|nr:hypothetical protein [Bacillota bacterium]
MKRFRSESELRQYVEKRLGPLSEEVWDLLEEDGYVDEVLWEEYEDSLSNLLTRARKLKAMAGRVSRDEVKRTPPPPDASWFTRSRLLAMEMAKEPLLRRFRRKYLPDGLLSPQEVTPWIEARAKEDGPPSLCAMVEISPEHLTTDRRRLAEAIPAGTRVIELHPRRERLEWIDEDGVQRWRFIATGGVLHSLQTTAKWIADDLDCDLARAVTFVLTDIPPLVSPIKFRVKYQFYKAFLWAEVTLRVRVEASPEEVAKAYAEERRRLVRGKWRPPTLPTLEMVNFRLDHLDMTWRDCWEAWNAA